MQQRHAVAVGELHAQRVSDQQLHYVAVHHAVSDALLNSVCDWVRVSDALAVRVLLSQRVSERVWHAVRHGHAEHQPQWDRLLLRLGLSLSVLLRHTLAVSVAECVC